MVRKPLALGGERFSAIGVEEVHLARVEPDVGLIAAASAALGAETCHQHRAAAAGELADVAGFSQIPWSGDEPPFGFSPEAASAPPWLPQPESWRTSTVESESADPDSMLELYRRALKTRRELSALGDGTLEWLDAPPGALAFGRPPGFVCIVNMSADPVPPPVQKRLLLCSGPLSHDGRVPIDTTAWFAP